VTDEPDFGLAVRMLDASGSTVGVGVLVGPREILTCAHLVNSALGRDRRAQDHPVGEVTVEFAVGGGPPLRARVQRWLPPPRTGAAGDDIAGLVLTSTSRMSGTAEAAHRCTEGTLRSRRSTACRSRASGNHANGWDSVRGRHN
jgi:hypothetical protein